MAADELERVVAVWESARLDALPEVEERVAWGHDANFRHFRDVVARENEVWVAVEGETLLGLLAFRPGVVQQLHVDPSAQGRGVGSALLDFAKARSPEGLELVTLQRNARARAFYEARGFRVIALGTSPPPESEPDVKYAWSQSAAG